MAQSGRTEVTFATTAPLPMGPFRLIAADPPWRFATYSETGRGRSPDGPVDIAPRVKPDAPIPLFDGPVDWANDPQPPASPMSNDPARHYDTMTLDEICAIPVQTVAADDCMLLMWVVDSMIPEALAVGAAWGFEFKTVGFYWAKQRRDGSSRARPDDLETGRAFPMGTGYWTRGNPEQCFLFTRGKPKRLSAGVRKLIMSPRREHSRKPDEFFDRTEKLVAGPYLELFARQARPGWTVWGNQTDRFNEPLTEGAECVG